MWVNYPSSNLRQSEMSRFSAGIMGDNGGSWESHTLTDITIIAHKLCKLRISFEGELGEAG